MVDFHYKYLKYKEKYLNLVQRGGNETYNISVKEPWFSFICNGDKTIEGRLNKNIFSKFVVGDYVVFENKNDSCKTQIVGINEYKSFEEYLDNKGLEKTLPSVKTIEAGISVYRQYYSEEDEKKYGVLAIEIKLMR
ncbi:MAG: ASCH domain protein [Terrestrivirus sp.]|uniref:ASCH domain protein n=1 Tax=Terrestrivirus sp. TaxID=2487775 RepID=A0A3G4ZRM0_9VIRU|nr:MAG: ASCH domain protein [Terrestrivirus sp.]